MVFLSNLARISRFYDFITQKIMIGHMKGVEIMLNNFKLNPDKLPEYPILKVISQAFTMFRKFFM